MVYVHTFFFWSCNIQFCLAQAVCQVILFFGLREKLLAAQRENMKTVILPKANQDEVLDFDDEVRGSLELVWVTEAKDALKVALAHVH